MTEKNCTFAPIILQSNKMTQEEKKSYALGIAVGANYLQMGIKVNEVAFANGFSDTVNQKQLQLSETEITQILDSIQGDIEKEHQSQIDAEKEKGRKFLELNKEKFGVNQTHSGLQYRVIRESIGKKPNANDTVEVHYEVRLIDGTIFDSSIRRGETIEFPLNQVIAGWTEGIQLMSEGSKFEFYIPSHLAYGDQNVGEVIKGGSTLIFEVELFKVK